MHQKPNGIPQKKAKYFGESSPHDLRDLERNAARAKQSQLAKAASYLEQAFTDMKTAWFGGWALNLRGSLRETHDLSLLILAKDTSEIRAILEQYNWYVLLQVGKPMAKLKTGHYYHFTSSLALFKRGFLLILERRARLLVQISHFQVRYAQPLVSQRWLSYIVYLPSFVHRRIRNTKARRSRILRVYNPSIPYTAR